MERRGCWWEYGVVVYLFLLLFTKKSKPRWRKKMMNLFINNPCFSLPFYVDKNPISFTIFSILNLCFGFGVFWGFDFCARIYIFCWVWFFNSYPHSSEHQKPWMQGKKKNKGLRMNNHGVLRKFRIFYVHHGFELWIMNFELMMKINIKRVNQFWILILNMNMIISSQMCWWTWVYKHCWRRRGIGGVGEDEGRNIIVVILVPHLPAT